jgi:hypothetical protein
MLLVERVRDPLLRDAVTNFRQAASQTQITTRNADDHAEARGRSNAAMQRAMPLLEQIHPRIGEILRTLDDEESIS